MKSANPSGLAAGPTNDDNTRAATNNNTRRATNNQRRATKNDARDATSNNARRASSNSPRASLAALSLLLLFCAAFAHAQTEVTRVAAQGSAAAQSATVDAATRQQVIDAVLRELNAAYVFPETAKAMEKAIRERAARKEYDQITDAAEFARTLTEHLQAVSRDKHLRVNFSPEKLPEGFGTGGAVVVRRAPAGDASPRTGANTDPVVVRRGAGEGRALRGLSDNANAGIEKVERLEGNVGLLEFSLFERLPLVADKISEAMNKLSDTDALIIDLRGNRGGASGTIRLMMSYLFDRPTHLNDYYDRIQNETQSVYTLGEVPGKRYGGKPVYVLTSGRTFSAAESVAYSLKNLKRATVVGETTAGGAHPITPRRINDHFGVAVPSSRYISPVTKTNWEGTGVKPDVEVPAAQALEVAHLAALKRISASDPARAAQLKPVIEKLESKPAQQSAVEKN